MFWVLLWLLLGHLGYSLALTIRILELSKKECDQTSLIRGLFTVMLGPIVFILLIWLQKK